MELRCPSCGKAMWAPEAMARSVESEIAKQDEEGRESLNCSTCGTAMPLILPSSESGKAMDRWVPNEPGPSANEPESPFLSRLAEPLPAPGYPDQLATRARFTAEIQTQHARILQGRPIPELLVEEPAHVPHRPGGIGDPLGSGDKKTDPTMAQAAEGATHFPPPRLGTPEEREINDPRKDGKAKADRDGARK